MSRVFEKNKSNPANGIGFAKRSFTMSALLTCLIAAGCATKPDQQTVGSISQDYRSQHPIIVADSEESVDLIVTPSMTSVSERHRNSVTSIVGRFKRSGAKALHIMVPAGSKNASAARNVSHGVVSLMKTLHVEQHEIRLERYQAANHGDAATIRITYGVLGAHVASECGQWPADLSDNRQNGNYHNFGCATQNNLAEMIANPADLLGPRGESEIDAGRRDNVISDWRDNGS